MAESVVASFDGTPIWIADSGGDGPAVMLLHGATMTFLTNFESRFGVTDDGRVDLVPGATIASRLRDEGGRVIGIDLRGHGRSGRSPDSSRYRGDAYARDVIAVADALGLARFDVVGYSMGAMTAGRLLGIEPRLRSAVLAGTGPMHVTGESTDLYERLAIVGHCFRTGNWSEHPNAKPYRAFARLDPVHDFASIGAALLALEATPRERLAAATVPVMVINGGDDGPEGVEPLAAVIPGAVGVVAGDGNHGMACSDDDFQVAVVRFVTSQWDE
jgi:pimeloyl-ACP methyl ester carboxylesterase